MMFVMQNKIPKIKRSGFSIIGLILVVILIAIITLVVTVVYRGVVKKVDVSDMQTDLASVSSIIMSNKTADGNFPLSLKIANNGKAIVSRIGTEYQYEVNNTTTPKTFCVTASKGTTNYKVINGSTPTLGTCPGFRALMYLDAGNVASYPGNGTTWFDLSNNKNDVTLNNGISYDNEKGGVFTFDGIDDYASKNTKGSLISDPTLNNYKLTYSFWAKVLSSNSYYIISSGAQTSSTGISFSYQAGGPFYSIRGTTKNISSSVSDFPLNIWINWTVTSDGQNSYLYKNGELQSSTAFTTGSSDAKYTDLTIGTPNNTKGKYMTNMKFASLLIYDRTLTPQEVQQNFDFSRSRYGL